MVTAVIMKRELFGKEIAQNSKTEFFSATDLIRAGNAWRIREGKAPFDLSQWLRQKGTQEFVAELEQKFGVVKVSARGRGQHTWVHPYLFIDLALSINPQLKIAVYDWLYDNLIRYRNDSGDSYKKMSGAIMLTLTNKACYREVIMSIANRIRLECGVTDWQTATEAQLALRDKIHEYIALLSDILRDTENLVEVAVKKAKADRSSK